MGILQDVLGDSYKEGMTLDEVSTALESIHAKREAETTKLKNQLQKANSEAAGYKKQLREKMSEAEQIENDRQSEFERLSSELAELKRDKAISDYTAQFTAIGYDAKTASENATAIVNGDFAKIIQSQAVWIEQQKKSIEKELMAGTPKGVVGANDSGGSLIDYSKKIEEAQANGNLAEAVYYTRLMQTNMPKG